MKITADQVVKGVEALGREIPPAEKGFKWVYLWGAPLRAMHWIAVACIVTLVVTGLYIGKPFFITGGEASSHFLMGWVRFLHFTAAALLVMTGVVRGYWLFAGNKYERLLALFPIRPRDWVHMFQQVKFYLMIRPHEAPQYLGHNPMQQLSYTGMYFVTVVMVVTGFAMYGQSNPDGIFYALFGWVGPLLGGMQVVRFVHHVLTWAFVIFFPIHIYLAMRADILEHGGSISSIISGGRFVRSDVKYEDE
jgi:Ni/Fe-hydrogenase b-type cytochrome subunit